MNKILPHLALVTANMIWALAYPLYAIVMPSHIAPLPLFTATLIVTAVLSFVPLLWQRAEPMVRADIASIVGASLLVALLRKGMLLFALAMSSPVDGSIIATLGPIMVLLISASMGIDRITTKKGVGLIVGLAGAVAIILSGARGSHSETGLIGNLMLVACAIISAIYMVWFKSLLKRYTPITLLRWSFTIAALVFTPFGIESLMKVDFHSMPPHILWAVIYLIIMPTYPPNLLLNYALKRVSPTVTSTYIYLQPIAAVIISMALHIERIEWTTLLYALVIFLGVGIVIRSYPKRESV
ncbi:MAG: DMT family transporter [Rikenellaceae bacterium]